MNNDTNANPTTADGVEESISSYFHRSAAIVRQYADLIEHDYAQPALTCASLQFKQNPIKMIFLSVFAGLSVLPLLSFVGLTVFTFCSIVFLAFISAAIAFITVEAILVACLVFMLWSLFIAASFITAVVGFVYWITRLGVLVTYEGPSGVTDWAHETKQHFFHAKRREATEESEESAVLVDQDGPSSKKIKVEEETPLNN